MIFEDSLKLFRDTDSRVNVLAVKTKPGTAVECLIRRGELRQLVKAIMVSFKYQFKRGYVVINNVMKKGR